MRLTVLIDNNAGPVLSGEWGLSFYIEADGRKILFDSGASNLFLQNAARLKIDLSDLDCLVFSHGHYDHTWGLDFLLQNRLAARPPLENRPALVAHPGALIPKFRDDGSEFGALLSEPALKRHFKLNLTRKPLQLTENLFFLGEIPRKLDFEGNEPLGRTLVAGSLTADHLLDDTALAYKSPRGIIVITGCSHAGICNLVEHARRLCGMERVIDIVGGFHLRGLDPGSRLLEKTASYLKKLRPEAIHPCHCTDLQAKIVLAGAAGIKEVYAGLMLEYE